MVKSVQVFFLTLSLSPFWTLRISALFGSPSAEGWMDLDLVRELPFTQNIKLLWCCDRAFAHYFGPF